MSEGQCWWTTDGYFTIVENCTTLASYRGRGQPRNRVGREDGAVHLDGHIRNNDLIIPAPQILRTLVWSEKSLAVIEFVFEHHSLRALTPSLPRSTRCSLAYLGLALLPCTPPCLNNCVAAVRQQCKPGGHRRTAAAPIQPRPSRQSPTTTITHLV